MANRTDVAAAAVHGTNPQNLVEKITRSKIYNSMYWKEHCFALDAETVVDKAMELRTVGGTYGGARNPSNFLCLILKLLQIQPDEEVIREYILQGDSKYLRVLGAFYLRLTGKADKLYRYIEPLYNDMRKVRVLGADGRYVATHLDELAEAMLHRDHLFDIALPRIPKRSELESQGTLGPRMSGLDDTDIAELEKQIDAERAAVAAAVAAQEAEAQGADAERAAGSGAATVGTAHADDGDDIRDGQGIQRLRFRDGGGAAGSERRREPERGYRPGSAERDPLAGRRDRERESRASGEERDPLAGRRDRERESRGSGEERERQRERGFERGSRDHGHERSRDRGYGGRDNGRESYREERRGREARHEERRRGGDEEGSRGDRRDDGRRRGRKEGEWRHDGGGGEGGRSKRSRDHESMSVEESDKVRARLGLAPLR